MFESQTINQIDSIRVKSVHIVNEPNRSCTIDFSTRDKFAKIFWFWCTPSEQKTFSNESVSISIITSSSKPIDIIGLHQVYFTKLHYCGQPQIPLLAQYVANSEENERIVCDPKVAINADVIQNDTDINLNHNNHLMSCIDDEYWAGNPRCLPKMFCELELTESSEEIISVQNAFIFNQTKWFAIEGTIIEFKCKKGFNFVTNSKRTCLHNSTWDQSGPICTEVDDNQSEQDSNLLFILHIRHFINFFMSSNV